MKNVARKAVLIGLGLGVATKEKAEQIARDLMKKGEANEGDVRRLALKILEESKKQEKRIRSMLNTETKKAVNLALNKSDQELRKLRAKLNSVRSRPKAKPAPKKRKR